MKHITTMIVLLLLASATLAACKTIPSQPTQALSLNSNSEIIVPAEPDISIKDWRKLLPFDAIRPVYDPVFINANQADLGQDELIMGVAWQDQAKAYPVSVLRGREMVNDELAGIPYLVSW
jgi:hypothetical protein